MNLIKYFKQIKVLILDPSNHIFYSRVSAFVSEINERGEKKEISKIK